MADPRQPPPRPAARPGPPDQALSGGGSETRAGSSEGGSAYGDDREDESGPAQGLEAGLGGLAGDAAGAAAGDEAEPPRPSEAVNNTGEPRPVKNRRALEAAPGDDVDAASG